MVGLMGWGATDKQGRRKGPWTPEEDKLISAYIGLHGDGRWNSVARFAGLNRSGKSCRLRWVNYLRPGLKRGQITPQEESSIIELHSLLGNKWSTIACYLPGRTDNEIKNYWRTHFKKKAKPYQRLESRKTEAIGHEKHRQNDVKMITNTEEGEVNNNMETQGNQEMMLVPPSMESQSFPTLTNNYQLEVPSWFDKIAEDGLWSSYWNADDPYDFLDQAEAQNDDSLWSF